MIMLAVNAGVIHHGDGIDPSTHDLRGELIYPRYKSLGLVQFLTEKFYSHRRGNNAGTDQGGSTNPLGR
jgi:hypothetical protein